MEIKQEQIQEKLMQFQTLQQYIEQISEHLNLLQQQYQDLHDSKEALQEFSVTSKGKILAPIANGIFIKAETADNQNLLVNVGADTVVKKSVPEVVKILSERQKETVQKINEAQQLLQEFHQQAAQIYREVEALE